MMKKSSPETEKPNKKAKTEALCSHFLISCLLFHIYSVHLSDCDILFNLFHSFSCNLLLILSAIGYLLVKTYFTVLEN